MSIRIAAVAAAAVLWFARAEAHHSFAAGFDGEKPFTLSGTVAGVEWANPHMHF